MLHRIIYISSATRLLSESDLSALLAVSRRNNAAEGLSGMMLYHDGSFLQVLEGPEAAVSQRFAHILRDPRHRSVIRLWEGAVTARAFAQWQMALVQLDALRDEGQEAVVSLYELARGRQTGVEGAAEDPVVRMLISTFLRGFRDLPQAGARR